MKNIEPFAMKSMTDKIDKLNIDLRCLRDRNKQLAALIDDAKNDKMKRK